MNTKYFAIVAVLAATLVVTTAISSDSAFATKYNNNQATIQTNECGNGLFATNVGCQNVGSQVQGDENVVSQAAHQVLPSIE